VVDIESSVRDLLGIYRSDHARGGFIFASVAQRTHENKHRKWAYSASYSDSVWPIRSTQIFAFSYAIVELFAGVWVILLAANNLPQDVPLHIHDAILVQLCAGLYVIIRAFDNISQSKAYDGVRAEGARMDAVLLEKKTRRQESRGAEVG
jgi:hypothetical protein